MIAVPDLVAKARTWIGVPFRHQGRSRLGVDCLGFIAALMGEMGVPMILDLLPVNYARDPQSLLIDSITAVGHQTALQPGVMLLIRWPLAQYASHTALYTGESMIHSFEGVGRVVENGYRAQWVARTDSIWALPEVTY